MKKKLNQRLKILILLALVAFFFFNLPGTDDLAHLAEPRAAIVDHLSISQPNLAFVREATSMLEHAGYKVDYYPGEAITVEFYKNLPKKNYNLIILRVHSALGENREPPVVLFTSEPYSKYSHIWEQLTDQLKKVHFTYEEKLYFGITPSFVQKMSGEFNNTLIIHTGCDGMTYTCLAEAFVEKGASAFIGWNHKVTTPHSDKATLFLLKNLIEKRTLGDSLNITFAELGPDPEFLSKLSFYPPEAAQQQM
jgi:hypothetical protein